MVNVNNASISCGAWPAEHGICANSYFDEENGQAAYMNSGELIRVETLFQRAARGGVHTGLLSAKRKTLELFNKGVALAVRPAARSRRASRTTIGDVQPGDQLLVVAGCRGSLEPGYRAHGSLHEMDIPLLIHNCDELASDPSASSHNKDLVGFLYR